MNWRDYLTDAERNRLDELDREREANRAERLRIYDRCRKRMQPFKAQPSAERGAEDA